MPSAMVECVRLGEQLMYGESLWSCCSRLWVQFYLGVTRERMTHGPEASIALS